MKNLDPGRVADSIGLLSEQIKDTMKQAESLKFPPAYKKIDRVVVNGMGGSNLGARIVASVFKDEAKVPILIEPGYLVPAYVDQNTLYIISSYSGNTEEPLSTFAEAKKRGAKITGITEKSQKNKLAEIFKKEKLPIFVFDPRKNPSNQPRLGVGYAIFALLAVLARSGVIKIDQREVTRIIDSLKKNNFQLDLSVIDRKNLAKQIAQKIHGKEIILVGAEFLAGNLHALRNQFNETAKNFAAYLVLPDLNHYALEGLAHPASNKKDLIFIFFASDLYHPRLKKRLRLTEEIARKNKIAALEVKLESQARLGAAAELLQLGSWLTFYLALLNKINPAEVKWVDWFKKKLA